MGTLYKYILLSGLLELFCISSAYADSASVTQGINFGTLRINDPQNTANIVLGANGAYGTQTNIASSTGASNGVVDYTRTWLWSGNIVAYTTATGSLECSTPTTCSGCSINFDTLTVSPTTQSINRNQTKSYNYGGKLTIPANCGYGTFSTSITTGFDAQLGGNPTVSLPITVVLEAQPIQVTTTQDLSFGTILSSTTHNVVVNPNGTRENSPYTVDEPAYPHSNGIIKITKQETASRPVTVSIDNSTNISLGSNSLSIDLTSSPVASSITSLSNNETYINVGGTLHVNQGAPAGEYTGTYNVMVTY